MPEVVAVALEQVVIGKAADGEVPVSPNQTSKGGLGR
jgi:hypothetical protein